MKTIAMTVCLCAVGAVSCGAKVVVDSAETATGGSPGSPGSGGLSGQGGLAGAGGLGGRVESAPAAFGPIQRSISSITVKAAGTITSVRSVEVRRPPMTATAMGARPCAIFAYAGEAMDRQAAERLLAA